MFTRRELMRAAGQAALLAAVGRARDDPAPSPRACSASSRSTCQSSAGATSAGRSRRPGSTGVDLTVRPGRPRAARARGRRSPARDRGPHGAGRQGPDDHDRPHLGERARSRGRCCRPPRSSGVRYFKTGYWRYSSSPDVRAQVAEAGKALEGLAALARECGIEMGFHNHAGLHRRRALGHRAVHRSARCPMGRLLLRSPARRRRRRRRERGRRRRTSSRRG